MVPPSHAWHWHTLWLSGLWPRFEAMKRLLVDINAEEAARASRQPYAVWDFSGAYGPALEPPAAKGGTMKWFWEPVHYKRALGDALLSRMMGTATPGIPGGENFGVRLDSESLESHLGRLRALQAGYAVSHPNDVARIRELVDRVRGGAVATP